jgi:aminoglycoside phosphotransferase (APT) family kinase protein
VTPADPTGDVVQTAAQAAALERPPLVVLDPLRAFLDAHEIGSGDLRARAIGDGHSNVTYELRRDDVRVVLRRPPRPPFAPSAHDVLREARLLEALRPAGVRVPKVLAATDDPEILGVPFFVMEHIDGVVVAETLPEAFATPSARRRVGEELVDALVELHAVDARSPSLLAFGRPTGYVERQLRRFAAIWTDVHTRSVPELDAVTTWLRDNVPSTTTLTVVHGDYRLGNVMFAADASLLRAVLDWEMATLGDPRADLGYLCATWARSGDAENPINRLSRATRAPGFASPDDLRHRYGLRSGRAVDDLRFYEVLALWKATIFLEASYRRYRAGTTDDPYFATLEHGIPHLARHALRRIDGDP